MHRSFVCFLVIGIIAVLLGTSFISTITSSTVIVPGKLQPNWVKYWGGAAYDSAQSMVSDGKHIWISGSTTSYGNGGYDVFCVRYNMDGTLDWERTWGGTKDDYGYGMALDNGSVWLTGKTTSFGKGVSNAFLIKFNETGVLKENTTWGGTGDDYAYGITVYKGNPIITGPTYSFAVGQDDIFVAKFNKDANLTWNKTWGGNNTEQGNSITTDSAGNIYVVGSTTNNSAKGSDVCILKYNQNGNFIKAVEWGSNLDDFGNGINMVNDTTMYISGSTRGYSNTTNTKELLLKVNNDLNVIWFKTWGGEVSDDVAHDSAFYNKTIYVVGETKSYGAGGIDVSLLAYNETGDLFWNKTWGTTQNEQGFNIEVQNDSVYLSGGAWNAPHNMDAFLMNLNMAGGPPVNEFYTMVLPISATAIIAVLVFYSRKKNT